MCHERKYHGTVNLNGLMYIVGGCNQGNFHPGMECFDPATTYFRNMDYIAQFEREDAAVTIIDFPVILLTP